MGTSRFSVAPNAGILHEQAAIDHLEDYPPGRRQHEIRRLLAIGASCIKEGTPSYNRLELSGLESRTSRFDIYLNDDVPEDQSILQALKDIRIDFKPLWLLTALVMGILADREAKDSGHLAGRASHASSQDRRDLQLFESSDPQRGSKVSMSLGQSKTDAEDATRQDTTEGIVVPSPPSHQERCHDTDRIDAQRVEGIQARQSMPKLPMLKNLFS